jgi:predicted acyltransferase
MENKRLLSLDALRGFTIAAMILVNFPGNRDYVFSPLNHTEWNGISFTESDTIQRKNHINLLTNRVL